MTDARREEIRKLVQAAIIYAIEDDLHGGESLMKEVWEAMDNGSENTVAEDEMRAIRDAIRNRP